MAEWQKQVVEDLHPIKIKIDTQEIADGVKGLFADLSLSEAIVQFGRMSTIYKTDEVKKQLFEDQNKQLFGDLFQQVLLNEQGQVVQTFSPLIKNGDDDESLKKNMIRFVAERRRISSLTLLRIAFQHVRQMGTISEEDLDFLVQNNAIIPSTRTEILREGLCLALNGKLYTAMHILLPQTEHIFRNLVKMCGDTVTFLNSDGSEEYKPLSVLFKSEKLLDCYNGDIIFTFQSIMDDRAGENLRNLNGHGIIDPETGSEITFLHFLSLLIKLLSLYSYQASSIIQKLVELEKDSMDI